MAISTLDYNLLLFTEKKPSIPSHTIKPSIPSPVVLDYRRGYINRYFIQRFNDDNTNVYEVNAVEYQKFVNDPFYNSVTLEWRLTGRADEIKFSNEASVKKASKKMSAILLYLPNYFQFARI